MEAVKSKSSKDSKRGSYLRVWRVVKSQGYKTGFITLNRWKMVWRVVKSQGYKTTIAVIVCCPAGLEGCKITRI